MKRSQTFPCAPASVPAARHFVASGLSAIPEDVCERVAVMVSELATNAVLHGGTEFTVNLEVDDGTLTIEVEDGGTGAPTPRDAAPYEQSGRGLRIVAALADGWGVRNIEGVPGKVVWFVVDLASV